MTVGVWITVVVFDVFVVVVVAALSFAVWSRACARETVVSVMFYLCYVLCVLCEFLASGGFAGTYD